MEATQLTFLAMQAGSNLSHDVGYLDFGLTGSLEEIVVVDEFISMNRTAALPASRSTATPWRSRPSPRPAPGATT